MSPFVFKRGSLAAFFFLASDALRRVAAFPDTLARAIERVALGR